MADDPMAAASPAPAPEPAAPADPNAVLRKTLVTLPITIEELGEWFTRIEKAQERTKKVEGEWDALIDEYTPVVANSGSPESVKVNAHFRNIHTKSGQLFVQSPEVRLTPLEYMKDLQQTIPGPPGPDGMPVPQTIRAIDALSARQAWLNHFLANEIDAAQVMDECLFDMQGYSGLACVHVEYSAYTLPAPNPQAQPDPLTGLPLDPTAPPSIDVPIHQSWVAERFDAKALLVDEELRSSDISKKSRWIGRTLVLSKRVAMRKYGLTEEELGNGTESDDRVATSGAAQSDAVAKDFVRLHLVWFYAAHFTDEGHPKKIYELVLLEGNKEVPVVYRPWQHQTFDERGQLTHDSLDVFPIFVGSLRVKSSDPYVKADSAFTNAQAKQLNTFRQQMVKLRDVAIGRYFYDTDAIDAKDLERMKAGGVGDYIGMKPGTGMQGWDKIFYTTAQVKSTPDDWRTMQMLKTDMDETLGISANQAGVQTETTRSATETQVVQLNAQGRSQKEKNRVIAMFLAWVRAVDILLYRYAVGDKYVEVVGQTGARKLEMWNKQIGAGRCAYSIKPDSQLLMDKARDRQQRMAYYNAVAQDPLTNRPVLLRSLALDFGEDPASVVLDPVQVNATMMAEQATGLPMGQPPHGGPANKHLAEKSGQTPNAPGAAASGDNRQERNPRPMGPA